MEEGTLFTGDDDEDMAACPIAAAVEIDRDKEVVGGPWWPRLDARRPKKREKHNIRRTN